MNHYIWNTPLKCYVNLPSRKKNFKQPVATDTSCNTVEKKTSKQKYGAAYGHISVWHVHYTTAKEMVSVCPVLIYTPT